MLFVHFDATNQTHHRTADIGNEDEVYGRARMKSERVTDEF